MKLLLWRLAKCAKWIVEEAQKGAIVAIHCKSHNEAGVALRKLLKAKDTILFKGSRGMQMEKVIDLCLQRRWGKRMELLTYISSTTVLISIVTLAAMIVLCLGPFFLPILRRLKFRAEYLVKKGLNVIMRNQGTPTMGGIMILTSVTICTLFCNWYFFYWSSMELWMALFVTLGHGIIGFIDDFIKVVLKEKFRIKSKDRSCLGKLLWQQRWLILRKTIWGGERIYGFRFLTKRFI